MSQSVRPSRRSFILVNRHAAEGSGRRVLAVGRISPVCWNCAGFENVQVRVEGQLNTVTCPVCRPSDVRVAVAR